MKIFGHKLYQIDFYRFCFVLVVIISFGNFIPLFLDQYYLESGNDYPLVICESNCTTTVDNTDKPFPFSRKHLLDLQTSSILQSALIVSIAVTFPIIIDQIMDFVTSAPKSSIDEYIPKRGLVLAVTIIDLLFLLLIIPEGYFLWIVPIFNFRDNLIITIVLLNLNRLSPKYYPRFLILIMIALSVFSNYADVLFNNSSVSDNELMKILNFKQMDTNF
eukprot:gene12073-25314_t